MGADLYRDSIYNKAKETWGPVFKENCTKRNKLQEKLEKAGVNAFEDEKFKKIQAKVEESYEKLYPEEGYFRDSYNATSVLNRLELSWWRDVTPMHDDSGYMSVEKIKEFVDMIESRELKLVDQEEYDRNFKNPEDTMEDWNKYFIQKKQNLLKFLKGAIEANEPISCSL